MTPLKNINDNYPKTVITLDRFTLGNYEGIEVINVIDWLLKKEGFGRLTDAHNMNLQSVPECLFVLFKCTSSATRISIRQALKPCIALPRFLVAQ